jgi:hypothetical protein
LNELKMKGEILMCRRIPIKSYLIPSIFAVLFIVTTPLPEIDLDIELPEGDPQSGYLTAIRRGCHSCHVDEEHQERGPRFVAFDDLPNIFERGEFRIADPAYEGRASTNWEYVIESILVPEAYFVPGDWNEPMPVPIYNIPTEQELADIIAWMKTLE